MLKIKILKSQNGFTLIEIAIALLIGSIMSLSLYQLLTQTTKTVNLINQTIDSDLPLLPFYYQLERDLTGIFAPNINVENFLKKEKSNKPEPKAEKDSKDNKEESQEQSQKTQNNKDIKDLFIASKSNLILSFITTGAIEQLNTDGTIMNQPYVRRVGYFLEQDKENPQFSKIIYKYQINDLDITKLKEPNFSPAFTIMDRIKNITLNLEANDIIDSEAKESKSSSLSLDKWDPKEILDKYKIFYPEFITLKGTYNDRAQNIDHEFTFKFKIPSFKEYHKAKSPVEELGNFLKEKFK